MGPEAPDELLRQASEWNELHRWEREELGKALRRLGLTYGEIRKIIPVPKGTLSKWCQEVALTEAQIEGIRQRRYSQPGVRRDTQRQRRSEIRAIRRSSRLRAPGLLRDPFFTAGVALYWAEGSKTQSDLTLANTDPALLRVFIAWVRTYLDAEAEFRLSLHLHTGNDEPTSKRFWRHELSLPMARFTKTYMKPAGTGHRKNHLKHGVCRVRVCRSANHWHTTMSWIECMGDQLPAGVATIAPGR